MGFWYTVSDNESLSRIAEAYGLSNWRDIYDAPENEEFRNLHSEKDEINPGDEVYIPVEDDFGDGEVGSPGFEDVEEVEEEGVLVAEDPLPLADEKDDAATAYPVCRNLWNTIDTRPGGYHWFSA